MKLLRDLQEYYLIGLPKYQKEYKGWHKLKSMVADKMDRIADGDIDFHRRFLEKLHGETRKLWTDFSHLPEPCYFFYDNQNEDNKINAICISLINNYYTFFEYIQNRDDEGNRVCEISPIKNEELSKLYKLVVESVVNDSKYIDINFCLENIIIGSYPMGDFFDNELPLINHLVLNYLFLDVSFFGNKVFLKKDNNQALVYYHDISD